MAKAPTIKLPVCDTCKQAFTAGQAILTSVSCGHSFHKSQQCVDAIDISQRFERVDVYSGGCRVDDCEYDGNLVKNSSEASPTTLLFRNLPLEGIVKTSSMQSSSRSAMIPVIEIPGSHKRAASQGNDATAAHRKKRQRSQTSATIKEEPVFISDDEDDGDNDHQDFSGERPSSSSLMPNLAASEESDSEEDEAVMASLIAASQALQRMANDDSSVYDETQAIDTSSVKGLEIEQPYEHPSSDEEEPPPDPYGMPPLSQWRRNHRR